MHIYCDLIHLGLPKCASSFLQTSVFKQHPEIELLFRNNTFWTNNRWLFFELRNAIGTSHFDLEDWKLRLASLYEQHNYNSSHKYILSFEGLSGQHISNLNDYALAKALSYVFGKTKILIILREQYQYIFSAWNQFIKEGGTSGFKNFVSPSYIFTPNYYFRNIYTRLQYHYYIQRLYSLFGEDQVKVLFLEYLQKNYKQFLNELYNFIGVKYLDIKNYKKNTSLSYFELKLFRQLNLFTKTNQSDGILPKTFYHKYRKYLTNKNISVISSNKPDCKKLVPNEFKSKIKNSNTILSKMLNKDLKILGYDTN